MEAALKLIQDHKLEYLPLTLKGDARRFFKNVFSKRARSYEIAVAEITAKFNTPAQQSRIKNYLLSLRLEKFATNDVALPDALTKLIAEIERFFPQVPCSYQCEDNKRGLLKTAILGKTWASAAIADLHKRGTTFTTFTMDIANGLQNWLEENQARSNVSEGLTTRRDHTSPPEILWQSRLGNPPGHAGHHNRSVANQQSHLQSRPFFHNKSIKCYNCGLHGHKAAQCRKSPRGWDAKRIVATKIQHFNRAAGRPQDDKRGFQSVLFELAEELNEFCGEEDPDANIRVMFGELLTTDDSDSTPLHDLHSRPVEDNTHTDARATEVFESLMTEADQQNPTASQSIAPSLDPADIFFLSATVPVYRVEATSPTTFDGA